MRETPEEVEREIRAWRPMPNGGHDPEFVRTLREGTSVERKVRTELLPGNIARNGANTGGTKES